VTIASYHHVVGFDVPVNDPGGVRFFESAGDLDCDIEYFARFERRTSHMSAQSFAVDVFGGDKMGAVGLAYFMNRENVWMVESRSRAGFLFETADLCLW